MILFCEQKNDSVVRRIVGYYRFEGEAARMVMADLYHISFYHKHLLPIEKINRKLIF